MKKLKLYKGTDGSDDIWVLTIEDADNFMILDSTYTKSCVKDLIHTAETIADMIGAMLINSIPLE